jgi:hypothetical protein
MTTAARGAACAAAGAVASGPVAMAIVQATHPQPSWRGAEAFVDAYHPVQLLPFAAGLFLVGGLVVMIAGLVPAARPEQRGRAAAALAFASIFAALIFLNYVVQTTFVPAIAAGFTPVDAPVLAAFTMANPGSLAWGLEMWGYGFLGVATWLAAPLVDGGRLGRAAAWMFVANGVISVAGALATAASPGWVLTTAGYVAFAGWNVLIVAMAGLAVAALRRREG